MRENVGGIFDIIGIIIEFSYFDIGFFNGMEYCYKIISVGFYGVDGVIFFIINNF